MSVLLHDGIPLEIVGQIVASLAMNASLGNRDDFCSICGGKNDWQRLLGEIYNGICGVCKEKALKSMRGK